MATPIGNAADISARALSVLGQADAVACEDTRVTSKLLAIHGLKVPLVSYHDHNAPRMRPRLMERLEGGETVALVSDAGTPLVSDPGYKLVRACIEAGIPIVAVPGPSATLTALVVSGLPTDRFLFVGYLPSQGGARRRVLAEVAPVRASLVFLEAKQRLAAALADMADVLGPREAAVARELTKAFEEVRRGPLDTLAQAYASEGAPRGEMTVVVGPPSDKPGEDAVAALDGKLHTAMETLSVRDAAQQVAAETGLPRKTVYARALELRREDG